MSEPEVGTDNHHLCVKSTSQDLFGKLFGGQPRERGSERHDQNRINPIGQQQVEPVIEGRKHAGCDPGRTTSLGWGSKVTATTGTSSAAAASRVRSMMTRWPACTPSKTPIVTADRGQSSGTSSSPSKRTRRTLPERQPTNPTTTRSASSRGAISASTCPWASNTPMARSARGSDPRPESETAADARGGQRRLAPHRRLGGGTTVHGRRQRQHLERGLELGQCLGLLQVNPPTRVRRRRVRCPPTPSS